MNRLQETFEYTRNIFLPHWDREGQWEVRGKPDDTANHGSAGESKAIILPTTPENDDELHCLLILETCRAIMHTRHAKKWLDRVMAAARKAKVIHREELAALLLQEVERYARTGARLKVMKDFIYDSIEDRVFYNPGLSYEEVLDAVAFEWGFRPIELEISWKRCKEVYREAVTRYSSY